MRVRHDVAATAAERIAAASAAREPEPDPNPSPTPLAGPTPDALLAAIVASADDAILSATPDGIITSWNPAAERLLGYAADEILGRSVHVLTPPERLTEVRELFERVARGERVARVETVRVARDQSLRDVELTVSPIVDGGRTIGVSAILHDLRPRRRANATQRRLEQILDRVQDGVIVTDAERRVQYWNDAASRLYGLTQDEVLGRRLSDLAEVEVAQPGGIEAARAQLARGESWRGDTVVRRPDGRMMTAEVTSSPIDGDSGGGTISIVRDVTEVRSTADLLRAIVESSPLGIVGLNADGTVRFWSPGAERLLGYSPAEIIGTRDLYLPDELRAQATALRSAARERLKAGGPIVHERPLRARDGTLISVQIWTTALKDREGEIAGSVSFILDMRSQKALEDQLRQAQKMEAIGQLAGGVAHDFNNILTAILGYVQLLMEEAPGDATWRRDVEQIGLAGERAATLVRQLLAFSRRQVLRPEVFNPNDVLVALRPMLGRLIGEHISIEWNPSPTLASIEADRGQVEQVLVNLAVNARDAMPRGGVLGIETANVDLDAEYAMVHADVVPGPYVMLAVRDTGIGMDAATARRIFEPFFTTKAPGVGTGLGLSTVYGIIRQSGGHIWVYSEPGRGTTFKLYFPRAIGREVEASTVGDAAASTGPGVGTVLITEDEVAVRDIVSQFLRRQGYRVLTAATPAEAIEIARREPIDLLVTDIVMPGGSGMDLAADLRQTRPDLPVLFMSGYTATAVEQHGRLGQDDILLEKPFRMAQLGEAVRNAIAR